MHYIIGTQITSSNRTVSKIRPGMTSQQLRAASSGRSKFTEIKSKLSPGVTYTLTRIHKQDESVMYTFTDNAGVRLVLPFDNVSIAENFISELRGEQVPDYTDAYTSTD